MEGQNILYGNVEDLVHVRGLVEAREKTCQSIDSKTIEKTRLEKDILEEKKILEEKIEDRIRKRRDQVVNDLNKEINKSQERLKKIRTDKDKAKSRKVKERIKEETQDLVVEIKNTHEEIKTYFKQKNVPGFFDNGFVYALYYPKSVREILILIATFLAGIIAVPSVVVILTGATGVLRVFVTLLMIILFVFLYMAGYNYIRVRNKEVFTDMLVKRSLIRKNQGKIRRIKKSIHKDKDEDQYGLQKYDEDIKEMETAIDDVIKQKNDALEDFEKTTKEDIREDIKRRDMPKIDELEKKVARLSIELKELAENQKNMSIKLSRDYGAYLGEENMSVERIDMLIGFIKNGQAANIGEAVELSRTAGRK